MHDNLKEGKNYTIMTAHKFEGEFTGIEWENGVSYAIFKTPGEGRYGPSLRKVAIVNLISVELNKTET